jgi:hypothetical protein
MDVDYVRVWQPQTGLLGDYNNDGLVDGADYVVWRKMNGQDGIGLDADGSGNGSVGTEDYGVWSENFSGSVLPGAAAIAGLNVPEPVAGVPMAIGLMFMCAQRRMLAYPPKPAVDR